MSSRSLLTSPPTMRIPRPGPRERLAPDHPLGQAELGADRAHLVLEQHPQRLDQLELEVVGQAADVVVGLDRRRVVGAAGLDHVRVERALDQEADVLELRRLLLEDADELGADDLALRLRVVVAGQLGEEALFGVDVDERDAELAEGLDHLLGLVHPHQAVVDEDAGQLVPDRLVDEHRRDRGVDAAGEAADHPALADLGLDLLDLLGDHRLRRPLLLAAGDVAQEAGEDLGPVGRVDDLGVELDPVEAAVGQLAGGDRRARAGGQRGEALGRLEDGVAVAHPAALLLRQPAEQAAAAVAQDEVGAPELARLRRLDPAAERQHHRLHPVTDAQHRNLEIEQLGRERRRPRLVDRGRPAGEDQRLRRPLPDLLDRRASPAAARQRPRIRGSAARSAASTGPRNRGPAPPPRCPVGGAVGGSPSAPQGDGGSPAATGPPAERLELSHPIRQPPRRPRRGRSTPSRPTARSGASCPRSSAPARPSPRPAGRSGCPRSRRWPSRFSAPPSG